LMKLAEAPDIDVHIMPSDGRPSGIGEEGTPAVVSALVDAVHAAGGPRIRRLPIMDQELLLRKS